MRYLTLSEVLELHHRIIVRSGGRDGIRYLDGLESALAQPRMTFAGEELYPTIAEKAAALGYSIIQNHPFTDGNKRAGHAATEVFLLLNGYEIQASVEEQERLVLSIASGNLQRDSFAGWLRTHMVERT